MCNQKRTEQTKMHKITNAPDSETQNYTVKNLLALIKNAQQYDGGHKSMDISFVCHLYWAKT